MERQCLCLFRHLSSQFLFYGKIIVVNIRTLKSNFLDVPSFEPRYLILIGVLGMAEIPLQRYYFLLFMVQLFLQLRNLD